MYTDADNVSFNISAEPVRIFNDSAYVSVKIESNESVNRTFKLKFKNENSTSTIKLDNNMSSTLRSDDFNITSKNDKVLEVIDNTTNESACNLTVLFKNNEIINYNNLILQDSNSITINPGDSIQNAINNAKPGDTIELTDGKYNEWNITVNKSNLTIKAVDGANVIVNADGKSLVFNVVPNSINDYCNIIGLTITGGKPTDSNGVLKGGGISVYTNKYAAGEYVNITNCTITNCTSCNDSTDVNTGGGGGVYGSSRTIVRDCTITNNTANGLSNRIGGGISFNDKIGTVINCTITNNTADKDGGGVYSGTVINCTIANNRAKAYGGGVRTTGNVIGCTITNNTLTNGTTSNNGGGIYISNGGTVTNSTITGNNVTGSSSLIQGGGVYMTDAGMTNCTIANNTVTNTRISTSTLYRANGGGVYAYNILTTTTNVTNCTITGNNATGPNNQSRGGGVYNNAATVNYCRVFNNTAFNGSDAYTASSDKYTANIDFNWWGTNNIKTDNMISGSLPNGYYLVQIGANDFYTTVNSSVSGIVPVPLSYDLVLNATNDSAGVSNLPDFNKTIYLDKSDSSSSRSFFNSRIFRTGMGDPI
ncbi:MAG: hypothetical protein LBC39_06570, partial [Methanobrevibacter sp.]|nr:hypothetical protein [Candidatus Methanovirga aequatorialis]